VAVAYDCELTHKTYLLIFHQVLYIKELTLNLISPNQLRMAGIMVQDCPIQFLPASERSKFSEAITHDLLHIPLKSRGVKCYFNTRQPTVDKFKDTAQTVHVELTSPQTWIPNSESFSTDKEKMKHESDVLTDKIFTQLILVTNVRPNNVI
jgi:hypothetical protein